VGGGEGGDKWIFSRRKRDWRQAPVQGEGKKGITSGGFPPRWEKKNWRGGTRKKGGGDVSAGTSFARGEGEEKRAHGRGSWRKGKYIAKKRLW